MKYKNLSDKTINVPTAIGYVTVSPGDVVLTAPKNAAPFIERGELGVVQPRKKEK